MGNKVKIVTRLVTPVMAKAMLEKNENNRPISRQVVTMMARDIKSGNWTASTDCIAFDTNGVLINGQHRLSAIIMANTPVELDIKYGVPHDAIIDKGRTRSTGDSLYMRGVLSKELSRQSIMAIAKRYLIILGNERPSDSEVADLILKNSELLLKVVKISGSNGEDLCKTAGARTGIFAALLKGVDIDFMAKFCKVVNTGFPDVSIESTPAIVLAKHLRKTKGGNGQMRMNEECAVTEMAIKDSYNNVQRKRMYQNPTHVYLTKNDAPNT